jgi:spore germination protein KA
VPHLLIEDFQINEDYYEGYLGGSIARMLRIVGFALTITVPALFIALTAFHQELIPTPLLLSIMAARKGIPFPIVVAALGMIIVFELLREAGARMPTYIGQSLSIVGALVIGQAAVEARIVSAPMVIVIAFSSITSLMISGLRTAALILRIVFVLLASFLGIYGLVFGIIGLLIHLFEMRSFGIPYMYNLDIVSFEFQDLKDTYIRAPWLYMKNSPKFIAVKNIIRKSSGGRRV